MKWARLLIVVVDDDEACNELVCEVLTDEAYRAIGCHNSQEGFEAIQRELPKLVITDLWMEQARSGFCSYKLCAANRDYLRENQQELRALNCEVLEKPFDLNSLLAKGDRIIDRPQTTA